MSCLSFSTFRQINLCYVMLCYEPTRVRTLTPELWLPFRTGFCSEVAIRMEREARDFKSLEPYRASLLKDNKIIVPMLSLDLKRA